MRQTAPLVAGLLLALAGCQAEYAVDGSDSAPEAVARAAARPGTETWRARVTGL